MDGDGRLDVLTGSDNCCDREPGVYWFRGEANGRYSAQSKILLTGGCGEFFMPQFRASLVDWDGDGRLEFVTSLTGPNFVRDLTGTDPGLFRSAPASGLNQTITARAPVEGSPDQLGSQTCIVDWDRDGRLDLVAWTFRKLERDIPNWGEIVWYRNRTPAGAPQLGAPQSLLVIPDSEHIPGINAQDWDGDGWPDLILGYVREKTAGDSYELTAGVRVYPRRRL